MALKPLPKKRLAGLKWRFRQLVDWAFDGNLSLASKALGMPFSTVQQYYQAGPKRISAAALSAIDRVTGLADWLTGEARSEFTGKFPASIAEAGPWTIVKAEEDGPGIWIPNWTMWRVDYVTDAMMELNPKLDRDTARLIVFGRMLDGLKHGLFKAPLPGVALPATVGGRRLRPDVKNPIESLGLGREAARRVHEVCAEWEKLLEID